MKIVLSLQLFNFSKGIKNVEAAVVKRAVSVRATEALL